MATHAPSSPPSADCLVANLAALWAVDPALAAAVESLEAARSYPVEPARSGEATLAMNTTDGRRVQLHSRYQPAEEARRLVDAASPDGKAVVCVHGMGLGYPLREVAGRVSREAIIIVFEPDLLMLRTAFEQADFSDLLLGGRVMFFWKADKAALFNRLMPHCALFAVGLAVVRHSPSIELHPDFHREVQVLLRDFIEFARTSLNTLVINGRKTAENIARNLGRYVSNPGIGRLEGVWRGRPAVIVSAGPSLRKNAHLLRGMEDRVGIIAVQTTLKPLLDLGIEPHFVTSLDYHEISTRFFEALPRRLGTELVAEPKANDAVLRMWPGPMSLLGNEMAEGLVREMGLARPCLRAGATVAHLAFYLAEHMGCDPIIFIGQDLGFANALAYTPGTSYDEVWRPEISTFCTMEMKQWQQILRDRPILRRIEDWSGNPMYTEERLYAYLQQFERDFSTCRARVIDATEGGARKQGATAMRLAEALERHAVGALPPVPPHPGQDRGRIAEARRCLDSRCREAIQVESISRRTLPLLEEIRDHIDDQARVNRAIVRIDALRAKMNALGPCYDLITQMTQWTELRRFRADRQVAAAKVGERDRQRMQVERDLDNVRGVLEAAGAFIRLLSEVDGQLADMAGGVEGRAA